VIEMRERELGSSGEREWVMGKGIGESSWGREWVMGTASNGSS
jgi:hypothetical protein